MFEELLAGSIIVVILLVILGILFYFLPTFVSNGKQNRAAIFFVNLFLGWTLIGWLAALIWAIASPPQNKPTQVEVEMKQAFDEPEKENIPSKIEKLTDLHKKGHLTKEEYSKKKKDLLDKM